MWPEPNKVYENDGEITEGEIRIKRTKKVGKEWRVGNVPDTSYHFAPLVMPSLKLSLGFSTHFG